MTHQRNALRSLLCAAVLGAAVALPQSVRAQDAPGCGDFTVVNEYVQVVFVDHADDGVTVGDARVGELLVLDLEGREIGQSHFQAVVTAVDDDGEVVSGSGQYILENGTLAWQGTYKLPNAETEGPPPYEVSVAVIGGTGEFEGAHGSLRWVTGQQGNRLVEFSVACPE